MAARPRVPTYRTQPSFRRVFETLQPKSEMKETPEAFLLHVYLPGFTKERVKITFVGSSRMVRITGERPIQGNRWSRFDQSYPVPENCEAETLQGKFELGTLVLTMPKKKFITEEQDVNTTQQRDSEKAEAAKPGRDQQHMIPPPPQYAPTEVTEESLVGVRDKESVSHMKEQKATQEEDDEKRLKTAVLPETITDGGPQKVQESKSTLTTVDRDKAAEEKREEEMKMKATLAAVKRELEEKAAKDAGAGEKERMAKKKDVKEEDGKKPLESRKDENDVEKRHFKEKEIMTRKVSPPKESEMQIVGNGIRELAASASHVVTRIVEGKLSDEEKNLVVNMGTAVLVIAALGAYVSYRFASSTHE